jgi:hypothetical protein
MLTRDWGGAISSIPVGGGDDPSEAGGSRYKAWMICCVPNGGSNVGDAAQPCGLVTSCTALVRMFQSIWDLTDELEADPSRIP